MGRRTILFNTVCLIACSVLFLAGCEKPGKTASGTQEESQKEVSSGVSANYPTKPIEIIVPYSAGGGADIVTRAIASVLPDYLDGATITVTNISGGNGVVGTTQLKQRKSDGYSIGVYASPVFEITPFMNTVGYTMDDFTFLGTVVQRPDVLVVSTKSPWNSLEDFISHANSNPGTTYGDPPAGSAHLGFEALIQATGMKDMKFIPYSGGTAEALTALLGNHVDAAIALPADTFEYIRSGDLRALCTLGEERIDVMKDIPTAKELGYDVVVGLTVGFTTPAGLDKNIAATLSAALEKAVEDPRVVKLDPGDNGLLIYHDGESTKKLLANTAKSFEGLIKQLGLAK